MALTQDQLNTLRERLHTEKNKLKGVLATMESEGPAANPDRTSNNADVGTEANESSELVAYESLTRETHVLLERIDAALARMEQGTYGVTDSGEEIPYERLLVDPTATTLVTS